MTEHEAQEYVRVHADTDTWEADELEEVFTALYGHRPNARDKAEGLWWHCCAAVAFAVHVAVYDATHNI